MHEAADVLKYVDVGVDGSTSFLTKTLSSDQIWRPCFPRCCANGVEYSFIPHSTIIDSFKQ